MTHRREFTKKKITKRIKTKKRGVYRYRQTKVAVCFILFKFKRRNIRRK